MALGVVHRVGWLVVLAAFGYFISVQIEVYNSAQRQIARWA
jgi:hypothetical protein